MLFGPHILEPWHRPASHVHRLHEHGLGPHPQPVVPVLLPVDHQFFLGLAVAGHTDDGVPCTWG